MLRRHPTSITLTQEDIATYDDTRDVRAARLNHLLWGGLAENFDPAAYNHNARTGNGNGVGRQGDGKQGQQGDDPNDELKPLPGSRSEHEIRREREGRIMGGAR